MGEIQKTRREVLKAGGGLLAAGAFAPSWLQSVARESAGKKSTKSEHILVLVDLAGGNDGLNTVVPFEDDLYYKARPTLAIKKSEVLKLNNLIGLHPSLKKLKDIYEEGHLAVLQSVGYPNPDRSHFRAAEIYQSARVEGMARSGWVGRRFDSVPNDGPGPCSCRIGNQIPMVLLGEKSSSLTLENADGLSFQTNDRKREDRDVFLKAFKSVYSTPRSNPYLKRLQGAAYDAWTMSEKLRETSANYQSEPYPNNALANGLKLIAQMIHGDFGMRVYYVALGGFDTHAYQRNPHANLLTQVGDSLSAFYRDLQKHNQSSRVLTLTFSEFGRRVRENASQGTDHGTSIPMFLIGDKIKGGVYGNNPDLKNLRDGDPVHDIDFRRVYASLLRNWWGADPDPILGGRFEPIALL